jgi:lysine-specific demethylase 8
VGRKRIRLYSPHNTPFLYPHTGKTLKNTSQVPCLASSSAAFLLGEPAFGHCRATRSDRLASVTLPLGGCQIDVERPDLERFPLFAQAQGEELVLEAGEMLYLPPHYWHFVRSLSVSFSISFWFD